MIKGIIFDLGTTLIKFNSTYNEVAQQGAVEVATWYVKKKRIKLDTEALAAEIITQRKVGLKEAEETGKEFLIRDGIVKALQTINAPKRAEAFAMEATIPFFKAEEDAYTLFSDTLETLKALYAKKFKLAILSNAPDDALVQRLVNRYGLRPWVSPVFSSAGLGWRKPKTEPFSLIAKRWGLNVSEIVVVGDTLETDILGGHNAGMKTVWLNRNGDTGNIKPNATLINLTELINILPNLL